MCCKPKLCNGGARAFLIKAEDVAGRVAKRGDPRGVAGGIALGRGDDLPAMSPDLGKSGIDVIDPDVGQQPWLARDFAASDPSAADITGGVIETRARCVAVTDVPAEYLFVESNGL